MGSRKVCRFRTMPTLRRASSQARISGRPGQPAVLLDSESPYGSRRVVVEYDGTTTAAYLHDGDGPDRGHLDRQPRAGAPGVDLAGLGSGRRRRCPRITPGIRTAGRRCDPQSLRRAVAGGRRRRRHPGGRRAAGGHPRLGRHVHAACPATAATSSGRHRSAGPWTTPWRASGPRISAAAQFWRWRRGPHRPGLRSSRPCSATCSAGWAQAASTGTSAVASSRSSASPSGRRCRSGPTRSCPRSG